MRINVLLAVAALLLATFGEAGAQGHGRGDRLPPPIPLSPDPVNKGAKAPDGIGEAVRDRTRTVGEMSAETMTYTPWEDASVIDPLPVGASIPADSNVLTMDEKPFSLNDAVASKPTVLIFYRGGWCPYCNAHLRQLRESVPDLQEMGYQLLAISPDTPEQLRDMDKDANLGYQLLSDENVAVGEAFGLRFKLTQRYIDHVVSVQGPEKDLGKQNNGYMLTPGAFVLDTNGIIKFAYVNNNYTVRVGQEALLDAARAALQ